MNRRFVNYGWLPDLPDWRDLRFTASAAVLSGLPKGYPFVFGFTVYESFESDAVAKTGKLNMPKKSEAVVGGHAVLAVGYDDKTKRFIARNSWGSSWGQKGYFTIPYAYLTNENLSDDFWTIRLVEVSPAKRRKKI